MADSVAVPPGATCWRPLSASVGTAGGRCDRPTAGGAAPSAQVHRAAGRRSWEAATASMRVFLLSRSHYRFVLDGKDDLWLALASSSKS